MSDWGTMNITTFWFMHERACLAAYVRGSGYKSPSPAPRRPAWVHGWMAGKEKGIKLSEEENSPLEEEVPCSELAARGICVCKKQLVLLLSKKWKSQTCLLARKEKETTAVTAKKNQCHDDLRPFRENGFFATLVFASFSEWRTNFPTTNCEGAI